MAKAKDVRVKIILECNSCVRKSVKKNILLKKIDTNTPHRLEFRKFCPYCYKHTIHGEIKK
ncbi:hypothetical protein RND81_O014700 [Saponaria officinalis]|uniref:50S ribosomal protein L33, chloroplastic n=1 Tax=Saponaria officinalis TaxID=3572 RepID=A0AAW1GFS6_SAPOF